MSDHDIIEDLFRRWQKSPEIPLEALCKDVPHLLAELEARIARAAVHAAEIPTVSSQAPPRVATLTTESRPAQYRRAGEQIGAYTLRKLLGKGGFGEVWLADRADPFQRVAIKFILPHRADPTSVARFKLERQALASLDHPGIAKIFDAGVFDNSPYAVMEFVPGVRLNEYCDTEKLSITARLELFCQICDAVHHAHQNGFIHRDLSPDNILVTMNNNKPHAKIIDFGIAKVVNRNVQFVPGLTDDLHVMIGKPEYMSPEQAEASQTGIDTRADIFSLGVVLYELLTGVLPLSKEELRHPAIGVVLEVLRRPRTDPSTRFTRLDPRTKASASALRGELSAKDLTRMLSGRLRHIPMTAMRIDRTKRFSSAAAMALDLRNYLEQKDFIEAAAEPWWDRARRNLLRHRAAASVAASIFVLLAASTIVFAVLRQEAERQRDSANSALTREQQARAETDRTQVALQEQQKQTITERDSARQRLVSSTNFEGRYRGQSGDAAQARQLLYDALALPAQAGMSPLWISAPLLALNARHAQPLSDTGAFGPLDEPVRGVAYAPDGQRAISGGDDNALTHWDVRTGSALRKWATGQARISCVVFSPDGKFVLSGSFDDSIKLWNLDTAKEVRPFGRGHTGPVNSIAFSPDGSMAVSTAQDRSAKVWDVATGAVVRTLAGHGSDVWSAVFSPDGSKILCAEQSGNAVLWDVGGQAAPMSFPAGAPLTCAAFSRDGRAALAGCVDGTIRIWDIATGKLLRSLAGHAAEVWCLAVSPDGRWVASGSTDKTIKLWDMATGKERQTLYGHSLRINTLAFAPDSTVLLSGGEDCAIKLWSVENDREVPALRGHTDIVTTVAVSADGRMALSGGEDRTLRLWDVATGLELNVFSLTAPVRAAAFSAAGTRVLAGAGGGVTVCDPISGKNLRTVGTGEVLGLSGDGGKALCIKDDHTLTLWDIEAGALVRPMTIPGNAGNWPGATPIAGAFSLDGKMAVSGSIDGTTLVWDFASAQPKIFRNHNSRVMALAFSPDGKSVLSAADDSTNLLHWDRATGETKHSLESRAHMFLSAGFSADGRVSITGSDDGVLKLWDLAPGAAREICTLGESSGKEGVTAVAFGANGSLAISGEEGNVVKIWDFMRPERHRELEHSLSEARASVGQQPPDAVAQLAFGEWYALNGPDDWALEFLLEARKGGMKVSSLLLGQCCIRLKKYKEALAYYQEALGSKEAPAAYLDCCIAALNRR